MKTGIVVVSYNLFNINYLYGLHLATGRCTYLNMRYARCIYYVDKQNSETGT